MGLGSEIRDPEKKPIPDPGPGSGSATLVVDRHLFDADPDPDPDWHQNDADPHSDLTPSFTHVGQ
jgi:hypothetical protein